MKTRFDYINSKNEKIRYSLQHAGECVSDSLYEEIVTSLTLSNHALTRMISRDCKLVSKTLKDKLADRDLDRDIDSIRYTENTLTLYVNRIIDSLDELKDNNQLKIFFNDTGRIYICLDNNSFFSVIYDLEKECYMILTYIHSYKSVNQYQREFQLNK